MSSLPNAAKKEVKAMLICVAEVASLLGVSVRTVWRKQSIGQIPAPVRIGALVRWRRTEIIEWIEEGCPVKEKK